MTEQRWISVGVDGSDGSQAAARWAAHEAQRIGAAVRLVHVFTDYMAMPSFYAGAYPTRMIEGQVGAARIVQSAAEALTPILDGRRVEQVVLRGDLRTGLLRAAADSDLLVLGDAPHPAHRHLITGSIIGPIAAHSSTPVAVVAANAELGRRRGVVIAGVKSLAHSQAMIREAFELAAARAARLVLVHAWEASSSDLDAVIDDADLPDWAERASAALQRAAHEVSREFPGVQSEVWLIEGPPASVLVEASSEADLVAMTRGGHRFPFDHLGETSRAVLGAARCPALVLPGAVEAAPTAVATAGVRRAR